ncbi:BnaCnng55100D [Brassica napus]|uniref:BnaCnng55100D protein n=1 Tax=Brassica napus TaxID=3708 RepID=A0A078JKZ9_BRANA|nr:BnaCnng55100D [Brassica napus]
MIFVGPSRWPYQSLDYVFLKLLIAFFGFYSDPEAQVHRKKAGGFRGQLFSEGREKEVSYILYDIWNIKYLTKFKWDDHTEEIGLLVLLPHTKVQYGNRN